MKMTIAARPRTRPAPESFFPLALGLSWLFWIPLALWGGAPMQFPFVILMTLGGLGPALAEILLIFGFGTRAQQRDYWRRIFDLTRIDPGWLVVTILLFPILNAVALLLNAAMGGAWPAFETAGRLWAQPLTLVPYVLFMFVFGPLPEELGWSGYALDAVQSKWSALTSSLIIGGVWAIWHLPLFFVAGTFQHTQIGFGTATFWWYILPTLPISVLDTWIYNNTHRSTLAAALLHFMVNLSGELFGLTGRARCYQAGLIFLVTAAVVVIWGPETLTRDGSRAGQGTGDASASRTSHGARRPGTALGLATADARDWEPFLR
jgi:membrane protease YdiL (CAAX protease family)